MTQKLIGVVCVFFGILAKNYMCMIQKHQMVGQLHKPYKKLKKDPTATQETSTLLRLHNNGELTRCIYNRIRPTGSSPLGLPKIHKPDIPLTPIVSWIGAPSYKLSKYIASVISPLAGKTSSHVLNFVGIMKDVRVEAEEALVTSWFTNHECPHR